jgi:hypothetical protein
MRLVESFGAETPYAFSVPVLRGAAVPRARAAELISPYLRVGVDYRTPLSGHPGCTEYSFCGEMGQD